MKKLVFISACFLTILATDQTAQAQSGYTTSAGLRFGYYTYLNASVKHFISEPAAIEAYAGFRSWGVPGFRYSRMEIGGLYQHHFPLSVEKIPGNLQWYVGAGPYVNIYTGEYLGDSFGAGAMGGVGLDYTMENLPLNFSFDWYLGVHVLGGFGLGFRQGGLSVRYIIK